MKEQRIIRSRILNQPMHSAQNILLRRLAHRVLQIIRQDDHVLTLIPKVLKQVRRHVLDVVDAPAQLPALPEVVDPDQQRLAPPRAVRVLEVVVLRRAVAKSLGSAGGRGGRLVVTVHVGVGVDRWETWGRGGHLLAGISRNFSRRDARTWSAIVGAVRRDTVVSAVLLGRWLEVLVRFIAPVASWEVLSYLLLVAAAVVLLWRRGLLVAAILLLLGSGVAVLWLSGEEC